MGLSPRSIAVTPDGNKGFVTTGACLILVFDFASDAPFQQIEFGSASVPGRIAIDGSGNRVFATDPLRGTIAEIDTSTHIIANTRMEAGANAVAVDNDDQNLFVGTSARVVRFTLPSIDSSAFLDGRSIALGASDEHLFVAGRVAGPLGVAKIDVSTFAVSKNVPFNDVRSLAISPDNDVLLVSTPESGQIHFLATDSLSENGTLTIPGGVFDVATHPGTPIGVVTSGGRNGIISFLNVPSRSYDGSLTLTECRNLICPPGFFCDLSAPCSPTAVTIAPCPSSCTGDCDLDGAVTVDEILTGVEMALHGDRVEQCAELDVDLNTHITVDEIVLALNAALAGC